ncbi:L-lactate dehydrogenase [Clostridium botulinum]|nr:L-lactate dehydrogenase [Clostridium botulinum]
MGKKRNITKISVIGAGSVGATTAYALMLAEVATEIVLVDVNKAKTTGEAMDLSHGAAFVKPVNILSGDYKDTEGSDIIVITAGAAQKVGETRLQLINKNISIFKSIIPEVVKYNKDAILLVVSNPVDVLSYVTYKLSGFPKERVIGSGTVLDTSRLKHEIGKRYNIDPRNVNTYIMGEHGDSEIATWSLTNIENIKIDEYATKENLQYNSNFRKEVYENVKNAAYEVINRKGATFYAIALAVTRIVKAILGDEKTILPVSTLVENYYGIKDVYLGMPCIVGGSGIEKALNIDLSKTESAKLIKSAETLKNTLNNVSGL